MRANALPLALLLIAVPVRAQHDRSTITLAEALARARQTSVITAANAGVTEAEANLHAQSRLFRENPRLEADAGPRRSPAGTTIQRTVSIEQGFEIGGRRAARIARAQADLAAAIAERDAASQQYLRDVALAYIAAADADARVSLAKDSETITAELLRIAERRYAVGDIPVLDVNVAKAALSQARSDLLVAEGAQERAIISLKARLAIPRSAPLSTTGDLAADITVPDLPTFMERTQTNPEIRRLEAEVRQARADLQIARGLRWPDLALRAEESKEEASNILLGGVLLSLPLFNRGQGERATATARLHRAELQLDVARQNAIADASGAYTEYLRQRAAADQLKLNALPLVADNVHLTERSYEVGEIDLAVVLTVRRQALDVRTHYLDRVRDAAETAIDVRTRAGMLGPE